MVRQGRISREEARVHKDKNVITRAVGAVEEIQVDICEMEIDTDSQILMCTDGLSNMIPDDEILTILRTQRDIVEKVERLVQTANDNGGTDNITVVVIEPF
jgi:protein phosphatase